MPIFTLIVIALLFSVYGLVCAIHTGISLKLLYPKVSTKKKPEAQVLSFRWRLVDGLVILLTIGLAILDKNAYLSIDDAVFWFLIIAIVGLIIRFFAISILQKTASRLVMVAYAISSYVIPLCFSAIGIYLVTGQQFWQNLVGWSLILATGAGLRVVGLSAINRGPKFDDRPKLKDFVIGIFGIWVVLLGFAYPLALEHFNSELIGLSLNVLEIVVIIGSVGYAVASIFQKKYHELYQFAFVIAFFTPILLLWNNRPYFISQTITLSQAFRFAGYSASCHIVIILCLILSVLIIGFSAYLLDRFLDINSKIGQLKLLLK